MIAHNFRPVSHVTGLIRKLEKWRNAREKLNNDPDRTGRKLSNSELDMAVAYLEEYRLLIRRLREIQKLWNNGRIDLLAGE